MRTRLRHGDSAEGSGSEQLHKNIYNEFGVNNITNVHKNKTCHGNMRHVIDGAKLFISQTATGVRNKQFCPVKNMAHITVKVFINPNHAQCNKQDATNENCKPISKFFCGSCYLVQFLNLCEI